jgi:tRNA modification GTPase
MSASPSNRVCVLTPGGRAAVASIAIEGEGAVEAVSRFFRPASGKPLADAPLQRIVYGEWGGVEKEVLAAGEGVVICRTAPRRVEIHCHGGKAALAAIVASLASAGCEAVDWRDWVTSTEGDAIAAEARIALAEAPTQRTAAILLDQYRGALRHAVDAARMEFESGQSDVARDRLEELLRYALLGSHLTRPWRVVLAGRPNVGKSSLINTLVGYDRAIVHDQPGVTRDVLTASTALDGWPIELADTAGLRDSADPLESAGVARTREELQLADVIVLVFDATEAWSEHDRALLAATPDAILIHNKSDLAKAESDRPAGLATSAVTGLGLDELKSAIVARLVPHPPAAGAAVPFTPRQVDLLRAVLDRVESHDLQSAAQRLAEWLGSE